MKTGLMGMVALGLIAADSHAQARWESFPSEQSRLVLELDGFTRKPGRAQELTGLGGSNRVRMFQYTWGSTTGRTAYADMMIQQATGGGNFDRDPDYVTLIQTVWPAVKAKSPVFGTEEKTANAPLGAVKYRTVTLAERHCLAFGSAFGPILDARTQMAGYKLVGGQWLFGLYCPAANERLTPDGAAYVLEGMGWTDTAVAKPDRAKPAQITTQ